VKIAKIVSTLYGASVLVVFCGLVVNSGWPPQIGATLMFAVMAIFWPIMLWAMIGLTH
jgi:hypothetical protein